MYIVTYMFIGVFLCNCIPHLVCGLTGERFPTPFARPRGVGLSTPVVNFIWGAFNALVALFLMFRFGDHFALARELIPAAIGFVVMGLYLSLHFGKVQQNRKGRES